MDIENLFKGKSFEVISCCSLESFGKHIPELRDAEFKVGVSEMKRNSMATSGGFQAADIIVYLSENGSQILLYPAIYDVLKYSFLSLFKSLNNKDGFVEINFKKKKNGTVSFSLKGDISDEKIDGVIDKLIEFASKDEITESHLDIETLNKSNENKPRIRLKYNDKTDRWEPVNYQTVHDI